jgi:SNF2 family DNA or RNA helicase
MNQKNLHNYQKKAVKHIKENPVCGLLLDMGLGKTISTLTAMNYLTYNELEIGSWLVIGPKRVVEKVWSDEVGKWDHTKHLRISKVVGNPTQRVTALKQKADIYLISRDNIAWLCGLYGGSMLPFDGLVIDESSSFKNPKSQRFKALRRAAPSFDRVVILTGTPAPNTLIDIWSQIYLLDQGDRLGKTISQYRERYFKPDKRNGHIVYNYKLQKGSEEAIYKAVGDICISMKAEDYLEMPDYVEHDVRLSMPETLKRNYESFQREQVLNLMEGGEITALNAAALYNKLLQYANGCVYDEDKNAHNVHNLKIEALESLIEEANGRPVFIAWTYRHDRDRILKALNKYGVEELKTSEQQDRWNRGEIPVLIAHPASVGHGLNLQGGGNTIIWFGQTPSLELYQQFNARLYRQGQQSKSVHIFRLIVERTLDEKVIQSLDRKESMQESLLEAVKAVVERYQN